MILIASIATSNAQKKDASYGFAKGDKLLNLGIGVNSYYSGGIPLGASFEIGIMDFLSVGGSLDYLSKTYYNTKFTSLYIAARGSYHFNELLKLNTNKADLYAGATVGFRSFNWADDYYTLGGRYGNGAYVGAFAGAKWYFTNAFGAFAEVGAIGSTNAKIGICFKF